MIRYAISCLGCKVNTYEAGSINQSLKEKGYQEVDFKENADVYIIFTCAVTNTAASKSRQKINQAIRQNENALICVVGCYVQISAEKMKENEKIDILVGSSHKNEIPQLIEETLIDRKQRILLDDVRKEAVFETLNVSQFEHQTRAYLKIQDGCNQFCSYCIIPYARGKERSLKLEQVVENAQALADKHQEIVLAGIHTGRYGREYGVTLTECISEILKSAPKLKRIRISSIEITEVSDELVALMKKDSRIARHLHIPLQSGCDDTLKRMNRPYTTEEYYLRIEEIRKQLPDVSISTDLIVGFAQESDEEFTQTKLFINQCHFSFLHVFPFSVKQGTVAEKLTSQVSDETKKQRVKECTELSKMLNYEYKSSFINKEVEVLVEVSENGKSFGHSSEYLPITIPSACAKNRMVKCICTHMLNDELFAKIVEENHG